MESFNKNKKAKKMAATEELTMGYATQGDCEENEERPLCNEVTGQTGNGFPDEKHPLQNTWTLWYLENDRRSKKPWEELLGEVTSFDTVEDFWSLYNHIKQASEIKVGSDYSLFKKGIRPMWEDEANKKGGRWVITLNKSSRQTELDDLWLDVLLCLIGEAFENSSEICGAVMNNRPKGDKISIWTSDGSNEAAAMEIGQKLCEALHLERTDLVYQLHKDTMVNKSSTIKTTYTL